MFTIFPEGTRSKIQQLAEGHNGAALIALSSDAWIVPVGITGTEFIARKRSGFFARPKVVVRVGKPYKLSRTDENGKKRSIEELTDLMMGKVAELLPPSYQGVYSPEKLAARKEARDNEGVKSKKPEARMSIVKETNNPDS
jgi:1-acyl-sn-glycerol-3-phosphate acyltransferase